MDNEQNGKMTDLQKAVFNLVQWVIAATIVGVFLYFGLSPDVLPPAPQPVGGDVNYTAQTENYATDGGDTWVVNGDLDVNGTADFTGSTLDGVIGYDTGGRELVAGSSTVSGTLSITTSTHTLSAVEYAVCSIGQNSAAANATCTAATSGTTITLKLWNQDGSTAGTGNTTVNWIAIGQP